MLNTDSQSYTNHTINLFAEKPVGWSSACLDSTINYYYNYLETNKNKKNKSKD